MEVKIIKQNEEPKLYTLGELFSEGVIEQIYDAYADLPEDVDILFYSNGCYFMVWGNYLNPDGFVLVCLGDNDMIYTKADLEDEQDTLFYTVYAEVETTVKIKKQ